MMTISALRLVPNATYFEGVLWIGLVLGAVSFSLPFFFGDFSGKYVEKMTVKSVVDFD